MNMMQNRRRWVTALLLIALPLGAVWSGDVATFTNLGFSPDARVFMFAQYGIESDSNHPYAEIFTVDVPRNAFVAAGLASRTYDVAISAGQDGQGALYSLLPDLSSVVERYGVNHLRQGRLIYLLVNGQEDTDVIEFRDFDTGDRYSISMTQESQGEGAEARAAFYLDVEATYANGSLVEERVGRPGFFRTGVGTYRIHQVIASPDNRSLVVVVERITEQDDGKQIRYMVETVRLR